MAQGDRVMIVNGSGVISDDKTNIVVYAPRRDAAGEMIWDTTGRIASVQKMGGVKPRSSGTIAGPPILVRREELVGYEGVPGLGGADVLEMYPVFLDHYQSTGWFPSSNMRIVLGNTELDAINVHRGHEADKGFGRG